MNKRFKQTIVNVEVAGTEQAGPVGVGGAAKVTAGEVEVNVTVNPEQLTAQADATVVTVRVEGEGHVETPVGDAGAGGYAQGPAAEAHGEVSPDGIGGKVGASAGTAGGAVHVNVLGQDMGVGVEVGVKAELGVSLGSTTRIDLPIISIEGPNPGIAITNAVVDAATDLATDPVGTVTGAVNDVVDVGEDAVNTAEDVVDAAEDVVDAVDNLFGGDDEDDHIVTTDEPQGPRPPRKPGTQPID